MSCWKLCDFLAAHLSLLWAFWWPPRACSVVDGSRFLILNLSLLKLYIAYIGGFQMTSAPFRVRQLELKWIGDSYSGSLIRKGASIEATTGLTFSFHQNSDLNSDSLNAPNRSSAVVALVGLIFVTSSKWASIMPKVTVEKPNAYKHKQKRKYENIRIIFSAAFPTEYVLVSGILFFQGTNSYHVVQPARRNGGGQKIGRLQAPSGFANRHLDRHISSAICSAEIPTVSSSSKTIIFIFPSLS
uniref:Legume lectin domain-containing protein n=1 Tax=Oryza brachyantha TaxID=4533 RepID=J3MMK9_ORYBR